MSGIHVFSLDDYSTTANLNWSMVLACYYQPVALQMQLMEYFILYLVSADNIQQLFFVLRHS